MNEPLTPHVDQNDDLQSTPTRKRSVLALLPLLLFSGVAIAFYFSLKTADPNRLPSVLIGKPVPQFQLPPVEGLLKKSKAVPGLSAADFGKGKVVLVNVWASWCIPCHQEHPHLTELAKRANTPLFGINNKDKPPAARRFLGRYGNPYAAVGDDRTGRAAIEWGVYGVPETFIVDQKGRIAYRHVGPITPADVTKTFLPKINALRATN